ncbi:MAG: lipopolysaccharide biosynthesis protein [Paramuribaculum sp.]|nr:lipopolysaccharide biosynthesis protein [Paramuribaculum sp.]
MDKPDSLGHKATKGAIWAAADKFGSMGLQFLVNLILARLLVPEDFGIIGMLAIFIAVSQTLIDGGFTSALIQKKSPSQADFSTIFYWNSAISLLLYLILFASAPYIGDFYNNDLLCPVLRTIGITLIFNSVNAILTARLRKQLSFKTIAATNILSFTLGGSVGISLAFNGWGVWSLVIMQITNGICAMIIFSIITHWLPSLCFSKKSFKELFGFGGYILAANVLQTTCQNLQGLIIGKRFSAVQMGYYSQAYKLDQVTSYSLPYIIVQVMYPVYSSIQDDKVRLQNMLLMNIRTISFVIFPILGFLMVISTPLIHFLYGSQWIECAPYFSILCVGGLFACLQNINFYAVAAMGRSRELFFWSFYKWSVLIAALFIGALFGMYGILWGMTVSNLNIYLTNAMLANKYVGLKLTTQLRTLIPALTIVTIAIVLSYIVLEIHVFLTAIIFLVTYLIGSYVFNRQSMTESLSLINSIISRK